MCLAALLLAAAAAAPSTDAVALYDAGKYAEARAALEALDAQGQLSGPLLYRLFFCRRALGDEPAAKDALERARAALESEAGAAGSLEVPFYLANTYANLGLKEEARTVAVETSRKVAAGALPKPASAMESFQLGRLQQEAGDADGAAASYAKAVEGFGAGYPGQSRWARRYLAERAVSRGDFAAAEPHLTALTALPGAGAADFRQLALANGRLRRWEAAALAWREAVRLDPANADDPRYAARLADVATQLGSVPDRAPDGRGWNVLSIAELEETMRDAQRRTVDARNRAGSATKEQRSAIEADLRDARGRLTASGLEYALRGMGLREFAFKEGIAVLIFQDAPWTLAVE
jgi:tetratricopeptide (TPR) repeat protein